MRVLFALATLLAFIPSPAQTQTVGIGIDPWIISNILELGRFECPRWFTATISVYGGTANWNISVRTTDGGNWLTVSPTSGSGTGRVTVSADCSSWTLGRYEGTVEVTAPNAFGPARLTVSWLVVRGQIYATWINGPIGSISVPAGQGVPPSQWLLDTNRLPFTATPETRSGIDWVRTRIEGANLYVSFSAPAINDGVRIRIDCPGAYNTPHYLDYSITVIQPPPPLVLTPANLSLRVRQGAASLSSSLQISPAPSAPFLAWTATSAGGTWLTITPERGDLRFQQSVTVTVSPSGLAVGTYRGSVTVNAANGENSPGIAQVELVVEPIPTLQVEPVSLSFAVTAGATVPSQSLSISTNPTSVIGWRASTTTESGGNWLSINPGSGTTPARPAVSASSVGLSPGSYRGMITVTPQEAGLVPRTVEVTFTVQASSAISFRPPELQFASGTGTNPQTKTFEVVNAGSGTLGWTATTETSAGGDWLSVSPVAGTAPSTLTVTVRASTLNRGTYSGRIRISALPSANATNSPQILPVVLVVGAPTIASGGIVNAAAYGSASGVAPGSITSLFGTELASTTEAATRTPLPTVLAGTQILVNERAVPLLFVSPRQINFQMPFELPAGLASVQVVSEAVPGPTTTIPLRAEAPGIFTANASGGGQGLVLNQDSRPNSAGSPAPRDSILQIFCTGLGATTPAVRSGQSSSLEAPFNLTVATSTVLIDGIPAEVFFSGLAPGFVGLYQVNARIPAGTHGLSVPLQIVMSGFASNVVTVVID